MKAAFERGRAEAYQKGWHKGYQKGCQAGSFKGGKDKGKGSKDKGNGGKDMKGALVTRFGEVEHAQTRCCVCQLLFDRGYDHIDNCCPHCGTCSACSPQCVQTHVSVCTERLMSDSSGEWQLQSGSS
jgi:hypothetical protein